MQFKSSEGRRAGARLMRTVCAAAAAWASLAHGPALAQEPPADQPPPAPGLQRERQIVWTFGLEETFTDNVFLTEDDRKYDFITRPSAGMSVDINRGRATAQLNADGFYDFYARSNALNGWSLFADVSAAYALVRDRLTLEAEGTLTEQYASQFDASAIDRSGTRERTRIGLYYLGPRLTTKVADFANLTAAARIGQIYYSESDSSEVTQVPSDDTFGQIVARLDTGENSRRFQLVTTTELGADDQDYRAGNIVQSVYYRVSPLVRLVARAGYERIEQSDVTSLSAPILSAGVELRPNERSRITVEGGERYDRTTWAATADVRLSKRFVLLGRYSEILAPDQIQVATAFSDFVISSAELPSPVIPSRFEYGENLYDQTSFNKRAELRLAYIDPSQTIDAQVQWSQRRFIVDNTKDETITVDVNATRHVRPDLDLSAAARYSRTYESPLYGDSESYGFDATLLYRMNSTTDFQAGYRYKHGREYVDDGLKISENVALVSIQKRF